MTYLAHCLASRASLAAHRAADEMAWLGLANESGNLRAVAVMFGAVADGLISR